MPSLTPISASVGYRGANRTADVRTVQDRLSRIRTTTTRGPNVVVDGFCGALTIAAIECFQRMNLFFVDGRAFPPAHPLQALTKFFRAKATVTGHQAYPRLIST